MKGETHAMTTVSEVARVAGLSRSTVSYALSGKRPVSEATQRRIERAIATVGYKPAPGGAWRSRSAGGKMIGLLVGFHDDEFVPATCEYVVPIVERARELGATVAMIDGRVGPRPLQGSPLDGSVDGVVLLDVLLRDPRIDRFVSARIPGVALGTDERFLKGVAATGGIPGEETRSVPPFDAVDLDFAAAARMLVDHLHGLGHQAVLLVTPPAGVFNRGAGYAQRFRGAAQARAVQLGMQLTTHAGPSRQPDISLFVQSLLDDHPLETALIVHNDAVAAALPPIIHQRGLSVPRDLSVVSLFSCDFAARFSVPLTAIDSKPAVVAHLGVDAILRRLRRKSSGVSVGLELVAPSLVDRSSTGPPYRGGRHP